MLPIPLLERLHAGDDQDGALAARATDVDRRRLEELAQSDREILARYPPTVIRARLDARRRRARWALVPLAALAAAWLFVFAGGPPSGERVKGDPVLTVLDAEGHRLRSGAAVAAGEAVQLVFDPGGAPYAAVVSVDGRGQVTRHLPWPGSDTRVAPGAAALPRSFRLDDAPSFEVFYAVTADEPIDLAALARAAASGGPDESLGLGARAARFVIRKPGSTERGEAPPRP